MYQRVVTPLDGSETAEIALRHAADLARLASVPMHILRVVDLAAIARFGAADLAIESSALERAMREERRAADDYLRSVASRIEAMGLSVTTERREGFAAREIVAAARPDDLLTIASRGWSGLRQWLLGSVAEEVLRTAGCPVLLVRIEDASEASPSS
jgi:nucleotide-binding universal stress UspA family protein